MKKNFLPLALLCAVPAVCVPANAATSEHYNPVAALREARNDDDAGTRDGKIPGVPEKKRSGGIYFSLAPEYFFDFGSDLPDADGWGASLSGTIHFSSITPKWEILAELELLAFTAESGEFEHTFRNRSVTVTETINSANILFSLGVSRSFFEDFSLEALVGVGLGATYGEIKGEHFKTSSSGNFTTTFSAKLRGDYHISEHWSIFAAYRFAYISPSIASRFFEELRDLDLLSQSVELGVRLRF